LFSPSGVAASSFFVAKEKKHGIILETIDLRSAVLRPRRDCGHGRPGAGQ
jgi:hypothetical protein